MTLIAKRNENGFSWTLISRLGHMLERAQCSYGGRDMSYTILGIEFYAGGPQIWFPHSTYGKNIVVQLSESASENEVMAHYQLAHECIHLLSPVRQASVLEEGLATIFSEQYILAEFKENMDAEIESYKHAASLVVELLTIDSNAVKALRKVQPVISKITADQILSIYPSFSAKAAASLTTPFVREGGGKLVDWKQNEERDSANSIQEKIDRWAGAT